MSSSNIFLVNKRPSVVSVDGALDVHGAPVVLQPPGQPGDSRECPKDIAGHPNVRNLIDMGWISTESGQDSGDGKRKATAPGDPKGQPKRKMNMDAPEPPPAPTAGRPPGNTAPSVPKVDRDDRDTKRAGRDGGNVRRARNINMDAGEPPRAPMAGNPPGLTAPPKKTEEEQEAAEQANAKKYASAGQSQAPTLPPNTMWPSTGQMATGQNQVSMAPAPMMSQEQQSALRQQTSPEIDPDAPQRGDDRRFADAADATTAKIGLQQVNVPAGATPGETRKSAGGHAADQPTGAKGKGDPQADAKFAKEQEEMERKLAEDETKKKAAKAEHHTSGQDKDDKKK